MNIDGLVGAAALAFSQTARYFAESIQRAEEARCQLRELARILERPFTELEIQAQKLAQTTGMTLDAAYREVYRKSICCGESVWTFPEKQP